MQNAGGSGVGSYIRRGWRIIRWPLLVIFLLYIALIAWRLPVISAQKQSKETVALIQSKHLTLADVDGKHLPPPPDPKLVDATVAGVDANQNGIRDDVELAIFKKYPNSPYTRAAELQYAMVEQSYLTSVFDTTTWTAVTQQKGRAYGCLFKVQNGSISGTSQITDEVRSLIINNQSREKKLESVGQYQTSFKLLNGEDCDVDASRLSN